jgi:hypothetical protein
MLEQARVRPEMRVMLETRSTEAAWQRMRRMSCKGRALSDIATWQKRRREPLDFGSSLIIDKEGLAVLTSVHAGPTSTTMEALALHFLSELRSGRYAAALRMVCCKSSTIKSVCWVLDARSMASAKVGAQFDDGIGGDIDKSAASGYFPDVLLFIH